MNVSDIMTEKPVTILRDESLKTALARMEENGCQHLPVLDNEGHLVGILSDRDCRKALQQPILLREHWEETDLIDHIPVRSLMTAAPIVVEPNTSASEAARLMLIHHISSLPVMRGETLVGIITKSDILIAFMRLHARELTRESDRF